MHPASEQPGEPFPTEGAVIQDRVRRRLAAVLRQLDRRIAELESARDSIRRLEGELSAARGRVEQLEGELTATRSEVAVLGADRDRFLEEATTARRQYDELLATKTFRLFAVPRRVYGLVLRTRRLPRH